MHPTCKQCGSHLPYGPEELAGELVVGCEVCDALNVIAIAIHVLGLL